MIDATGIEFCEMCGLTYERGVCPACDPDRPLSKAGIRARELAFRTHAKRQGQLAGRPRWQRIVLHVYWWLTKP